MTPEQEIENLKAEIAQLKEVVSSLAEALKISIADNKEAKAYIDKVESMIRKL